MNILQKLKTTLSTAAFTLCLSAPAEAGSFILDFTDADDHGHASATQNFKGWLYMQKVLENLAPGVKNGNKMVVQLGASTGKSYNAAFSAFNLSSLASNGWNWINIDGAANIATYLAGGTVGGVSLSTTGLIQLDSGLHVGGGSSNAERASFTAGAGALNNFLGDGGGLHSMAQGGVGQYSWLSMLLSRVTFTTQSGTDLYLTPDGSSAFPNLLNSDLNVGPYHGRWTGGTDELTILLETAATGGHAVGIGADGGSITNPGVSDITEPRTLALLGFGLIGVGFARRRRAQK